MKKLLEKTGYIIKKYGINSVETYNMCIILSIQNEKKYNKKALQNYYIDSLNKLIEYIKNNENNPNESIWNKYAIKYRCLSAESLGYMYGHGFNKLCRNIRKKINNSKKEC